MITFITWSFKTCDLHCVTAYQLCTEASNEVMPLEGSSEGLSPWL